jgi:hypothetical protein
MLQVCRVSVMLDIDSHGKLGLTKTFLFRLFEVTLACPWARNGIPKLLALTISLGIQYSVYVSVSIGLTGSEAVNLLPSLYLWNVRPYSSTKSNTDDVAETLDDLREAGKISENCNAG